MAFAATFKADLAVDDESTCHLPGRGCLRRYRTVKQGNMYYSEIYPSQAFYAKHGGRERPRQSRSYPELINYYYKAGLNETLFYQKKPGKEIPWLGGLL